MKKNIPLIQNNLEDKDIKNFNNYISLYNDGSIDITELHEATCLINSEETTNTKQQIYNECIRQNLQMSFTWDDSSDQAGRNKGYVCNIARFSYNGEEVGYMKLIEVKKELCPNLAHYLAHVEGWSGVEKYEGDSIYNSVDRMIPENELDILIKKQFPNSSKEYIDERMSIYKESYEEYLHEWSKLTVAFVKVINDENKRSGLGTEFYLMVNNYLKDYNNRKIHADGTQSGEAKALWESFENKGWVSVDNEGLRFFNP